MAIETMYEYIAGTTQDITDEYYYSVGASAFKLGIVRRAFIETGFVIRTAAGGGGTTLILNTDYEFNTLDTFYTELEGKNVWTAVKILNPTYRTVALYISSKVVASYTDAFGDMNTRLVVGNRKTGLTLSNAADGDHDITIAAGSCLDSTKSIVMTLGASLTKQIDAAWAVGTNAGGLFPGSSLTTGTWYYVYLIRRESDGLIDGGFSTSATASDIPTGFRVYSYLGRVRTDSSANILGFVQRGNYFFYKIMTNDVAINNPGAAAVSAAISAPPSVTGIFSALVYQGDANQTFLIVTGLNQTDTAPGAAAFSCVASVAGENSATNIIIPLSGASNIRYRCSFSNANTTVHIKTIGWIDPNI